MSSRSTPNHLLRVAEAHSEESIALLERLVNQDSGSHSQDGITSALKMVSEQLERLGGYPSRTMSSGPFIEYKFPGEGGAKLLLLGHVDTVFPEGESQRRPFVIRQGRAFGPGIADMKAGIVTMLLALEILLSREDRPWGEVSVVVNADEEIGSPKSVTAIVETGRKSDFCLVFEPGSPTGAVVTARKWVGGFTLRVFGKAAHSGNAPQDGANAVLELAQKLVALAALGEDPSGVTINFIIVAGGDRSNVVPDYAEAKIDLRAPSGKSAEDAIAKMRGIASATLVPGTRTEFTGGMDRPAMEHGPKGRGLYETAAEAARALSFSLPEETVGAGSDGNFVAHLGVPTLDGLGACGANFHRDDEYVLLDTLPQRAALAASVVLAVGQDKGHQHSTDAARDGSPVSKLQDT